MHWSPLSSSFPSTKRSVVSPPTAVRSPPRRILVVDDDKNVREVLSELLAREGYDVSSACDGQDALRKVLMEWPQLIILDLEMPRMSGWEFLEVQAEHRSLARIPVLVISAFDHTLDVAAVLPKPFQVVDILAAVRRLVGPPRSRDPVAADPVRESHA
jgi:CheY-like chemotaxis protein